MSSFLITSSYRRKLLSWNLGDIEQTNGSSSDGATDSIFGQTQNIDAPTKRDPWDAPHPPLEIWSSPPIFVTVIFVWLDVRLQRRSNCSSATWRQLPDLRGRGVEAEREWV